MRARSMPAGFPRVNYGQALCGSRMKMSVQLPSEFVSKPVPYTGSPCPTRERALELTMSEKNRIEVIQAVLARKLAVGEAARILKRSARTIWRMQHRLQTQGLGGLVHGNKGRPSPRKTSEQTVRQVLGLTRDKYPKVNDTHLMELLAKHEKIKLGRETLRSLLRAAGLAPKRTRRRPKYRQRRERKEAMGHQRLEKT